MGTHPWGEAQPSLEQDCCAQFSWGTTWAQHPPIPHTLGADGSALAPASRRPGVNWDKCCWFSNDLE